MLLSSTLTKEILIPTKSQVRSKPQERNFSNYTTTRKLSIGLCLVGSLSNPLMSTNSSNIQENLTSSSAIVTVNVASKMEMISTNNATFSNIYVLNPQEIQYTEVRKETSGSSEGEDEMMLRRNIPKLKQKNIASSFAYGGRLAKHPRLDMIENHEIREKNKKLVEVNIPASIEYAGRLPKRPRI